MKSLVMPLLIFSALAPAQEELESPAEAPRDERAAMPALSPSPSQDSLARHIALLAVARAEEAVTASDLWHRLIPRVQLSASLGARDILFPDASGGFLLPRDSYRVTVSIAPAEILDGTRHALALLQLSEARARYAILLGRQSDARLARMRKCLALTHDLALAREQVDLSRLLLEYYELLFKQGKADFHTLTRARLDAVKMRAGFLELERRVREAGSTSP